MKIRTGFVSNSSSSSFIVAFDRIPRSVDEMVKILFKENQKVYSSPYDDLSWPVQEIAGYVLRDMKGKLPLTEDEIVESASDYVDVDQNQFQVKDSKGYDTVDWPRYQAACEEEGRKFAEKFIEENQESYFFEFSYADEDGKIGTAMEHGDLFNNVPGFRISHH
jgi:hypothetical protein